MKSVELRTQQEACADAALASYNFGDEVVVEAMESWQRNCADGYEDWFLVGYARAKNTAPEEDSKRISFQVTFLEDTLTLTSAYAYWWDSGEKLGWRTN